ncbi:hypothetical protein DL763_010367 [Monosporascus cannonballus]|nr:hypothetical protein DL763_010367 [Monosporascus cannonballus]
MELCNGEEHHDEKAREHIEDAGSDGEAVVRGAVHIPREPGHPPNLPVAERDPEVTVPSAVALDLAKLVEVLVDDGRRQGAQHGQR